MNKETLIKQYLRPAFSIFVFFTIVTGIIYPVTITIIAQLFFPFQSNGSMMTIDGKERGSFLIAQDVTSPKLFHPRNLTDSSSKVDPHITPQEAYSQVPRIANATGIPETDLSALIERNTERHRRLNAYYFADDYVNVNELNYELIITYPDIYAEFYS